jgi:hypothetical protein
MDCVCVKACVLVLGTNVGAALLCVCLCVQA